MVSVMRTSGEGGPTSNLRFRERDPGLVVVGDEREPLTGPALLCFLDAIGVRVHEVPPDVSGSERLAAQQDRSTDASNRVRLPRFEHVQTTRPERPVRCSDLAVERENRPFGVIVIERHGLAGELHVGEDEW